MDLRRVRYRLTILNGLMFAIALMLVSVLAIRSAAKQIQTSADSQGEARISETLLDLDGARGKSQNTWLMTIDGEKTSSEPFGEQWLEPPLARLAKQALQYPIRERIGQGNRAFLALARKVSDNQALVIALDLNETRKSQAKAKRDITVAGLGAWLLAMLASWWVAGRSLRPARRALRQQREFIADAAHEMRTPLAAIRASASQALLRDRDASAYRESLQEILDASSRARQGVDELLELARLEAGQVTLRTGPLRLDFLVEEVVSGVREDRCLVSFEPGSGHPISADADYGLVRQALDTLVRNAAARADNVTVSVVNEGKFARILIDDDGPGIPEDLLPVVFDRFRRGDTKGGVGLGMAIAKRIAELHKGTVTASNRDVGGASVSLTLPMSESKE
jgi:two-component system, OmpR family, sensor kinase